jgi:DNA-binding transcriptional ArsR family regulator
MHMGDTDTNIRDTIPVLPGEVPVTMPDLPLKRIINTEQQFKAISDPVRSRILGIIQNQPATAKQVAERLGATPGAIGHHLHVLEAAGLAQIVARRLIRGIVANYYTRTARIFTFDLPSDVVGDAAVALNIVTTARDELAEAMASGVDDPYSNQSFPHVRLSPERAMLYYERLNALVDDLLQEQPDPDGAVYGFLVAMFKSPPYMQGAGDSTPAMDD